MEKEKKITIAIPAEDVEYVKSLRIYNVKISLQSLCDTNVQEKKLPMEFFKDKRLEILRIFIRNIPIGFFKDERLKIIHVLVIELESWENAEKTTAEELFRLVNRLIKLFPPAIKII